MAGPYRTAHATVSAHGARAITPHDTNVLTGGICRAIYVGVTGHLNVKLPDGQTVLFKNVPVGIFPIQAEIVLSTSTTATELIALY